jgi:hypothetical protein
MFCFSMRVLLSVIFCCSPYRLDVSLQSSSLISIGLKVKRVEEMKIGLHYTLYFFIVAVTILVMFDASSYLKYLFKYVSL